jgi:hypothetical protein
MSFRSPRSFVGRPCGAVIQPFLGLVVAKSTPPANHIIMLALWLVFRDCIQIAIGVAYASLVESKAVRGALLSLQLTESPPPSRSLLLMESPSRSHSLLLMESPIRSRSDHLLWLGLDLKLDTRFLVVRRSRGSCRVRPGNVIGEYILPIAASFALQRTVANMRDEHDVCI